MFNHKWFFYGKVIKIIDGQTIVLWLDLGFEIWKKVIVRFNRIKLKNTSVPVVSVEQPFEQNSAFIFIEKNLLNKQIYCRILQKKDTNGFNRFFAEIYTPIGELCVKLKDINRSISDSHRIEGLINFNDIMVSNNYSTYIQFNKKEDSNAKVPVHNRSSWQHSHVRGSLQNSIGKGYQTDSSGSGPTA